MNGKAFFDTNVLVYAIIEEDSRKVRSRELLEAGGVISVQVLNEFVSIARRKARVSRNDVRSALQWIRILCADPVPVTLELHEDALRIAERYEYQIYDSLIIAAALGVKCDLLYSEDLQDGQIIDGRLRIENPLR